MQKWHDPQIINTFGVYIYIYIYFFFFFINFENLTCKIYVPYNFSMLNWMLFSIRSVNLFIFYTILNHKNLKF